MKLFRNFGYFAKKFSVIAMSTAGRGCGGRRPVSSSGDLLRATITAYDGRKTLYAAGPLRVSFFGDRKMGYSSAPSDGTMGDEIPPPTDQLAAVPSDNDEASSVQKPPPPVRMTMRIGPNQVLIRSILCQPDGGARLAGQKVRIRGCVRMGREQGKGTFAHLEVTDGSCAADLHVMVDASLSDLSKLVASGTCLVVDGSLKIPPEGTNRKIELSVKKVVKVGSLNVLLEPLEPPLRDNAQVLGKTDGIALAGQRVADTIAELCKTFPLHYDRGASKHVSIRSILGQPDGGAGLAGQNVRISGWVRIGELRGEGTFAHIEVCDGSCPAPIHVNVGSAVASDLSQMVASRTCVALDGCLTIPPEGKGFKRKIELTVQKVVAIGTVELPLEPSERFRDSPQILGKNINSVEKVRWTYLATIVLPDGPGEFWKAESEIPFPGLEGFMNFAEGFVKYQCSLLNDRGGCDDRLKKAALTPFARVTYTEARKLLEEAVAQGAEFDNQVDWGIELALEHERYLTDVVFEKPLIVYNFPKEIRPFYMKLNDDGKTVAAMDVHLPMAGRVITGSVREERCDVIRKRILETGEPVEPYQWYVELRRRGTANHAVFAVDFDGLIDFATATDDVCD